MRLPPELEATLEAPPSPERPGDDLQLTTVNPAFYLLGRELARGGMGRILLARDRRLGRVVALKESFATTGTAARRFEREARITARLQHPSIVSVHEAGLFPSGELFYAMTLVSGRALDQVIAETRTLEDRLALLPNVLAVADAMAYAHGQNVIHRDLKPGNVVVGSFGQTVVIDWGLAKDLSDGAPGLEEPASSSSSSSDVAMTSAGAVMGTPAYMPPEQALGAAVDARADVYSLGAILDHVLSGQPAFTGDSPTAVLEAVRRAPPRPLNLRCPGLAPELLAIVDRSMARDPLARYPTAGELSEDLRRYLTGQLVGAHRYSLWQLVKRWLRRYRAAVGVAAVALTVLLVLGAVAVQKLISAEALAQARRDEAESLVGFMLTDLRNKLVLLGKLDVLDDVARKAVAYEDRKGPDLSEAELSVRALAHRNLGDVLQGQARLHEALEQYETSLAVSEALVAMKPLDLERRDALSLCHQRLGVLVVSMGDGARALQEFRASLAIEEQLATQPHYEERARSLAHVGLGDALLIEGDTAGALEEFRIAHGLCEVEAQRDPASEDPQRLLSMSHSRIGDVLLTQGDSLGALAEFRAAFLLRQRLAQQAPTELAVQRDLSLAHDRLGEVYTALGRQPEALAEFRSSLRIAQSLAALDPGNAGWQRDLSLSYGLVGDALLAQNDRKGALAEYQQAMVIDTALAAKDPSSTQGRSDLSVSHHKLGEVLLAEGLTSQALTEFKAALTIDQALSAESPSNTNWQLAVSAAHQMVGDTLLAQKEVGLAQLEFSAGLAIARRLQSKDPLNVEFKARVDELAARLSR